MTDEPISRRDALKGGSAAAVAVGAGILQQEIVGVAKGQTNEPRIQLGPDYAIDDRSSGLVIEHQPSGATFEYDEGQSRWVTTDPLEVPTLVDGAGVSHSGELEDASHDHSGETINPNTVNTDDATINLFSGLKAELSSDQSYASADGWVTVPYDTTRYDDQDDWDTSAYDFTAPHAGRYRFVASVGFDPGADGDQIGARLVPSSGPNVANIQDIGDSTINQSRTVDGYFDLAQSDTVSVEFRNFNNDGTIDSFTARTYVFVQEVVTA